MSLFKLIIISTFLFAIVGCATNNVEKQQIVGTEAFTDTEVADTVTPLKSNTSTPTVSQPTAFPPSPSFTPNPPTKTPLPTLTPRNTPTDVPIITAVVSANQTVNVRQGDGVDTPVIGSLLPGEAVEVLDQNDGGSWFHIRTTSNLDGWVLASLLTIEETSSELVAKSTTASQMVQQYIDTQECQPNMRNLGGFKQDSVDTLPGLGYNYDYTPVLWADYWVTIYVTDDPIVNDYEETYNLEAGTMSITGVTVQYGFNPDLFGTPYANLAFDFIYQEKFFSGEIIDIASEVRSARNTLIEMLNDFVTSITTC